MDILGSLARDAASPQGTDQPDDYIKCSRKGCPAEATFQILWNNPKIHTPDRRKNWLACPQHVEFLQDFLKARSFWKATEPLPAQPDLA